MTEDKPETENTNLFKDTLKYIKENLKEIVLLINVVGFINYFFYYMIFNIPIFNYVGLNDTIFSVLEYVFLILFIIVFLEILTSYTYLIIRRICDIILLSKRKNLKKLCKEAKGKENRVTKVLNKHFKEELIIARYFFLVVYVILVYILPFKQFTLPAIFIYILWFSLYSVNKRIIDILVPLVAVILGGSLIYFTVNDGIDRRDEKQDYTISFVENNQLITTEKGESTLNYIGESSVAIFLYDIESKEARIFIKSNISDIKIQYHSRLEIIINHIRN